MCPSAPARAGAVLLGVIGPHGRVAYLPSPPTVDREMLEVLVQDDPDATGYRFASPCMTSACIYWAADRCHVPDKVRLDQQRAGWLPVGVDDALPACGIRPACRWWQQDGPEACVLCPLVSTRQPSAATPSPVASATPHNDKTDAP